MYITPQYSCNYFKRHSPSLDWWGVCVVRHTLNSNFRGQVKGSRQTGFQDPTGFPAVLMTRLTLWTHKQAPALMLPFSLRLGLPPTQSNPLTSTPDVQSTTVPSISHFIFPGSILLQGCFWGGCLWEVGRKLVSIIRAAKSFMHFSLQQLYFK